MAMGLSKKDKIKLARVTPNPLMLCRSLGIIFGRLDIMLHTHTHTHRHPEVSVRRSIQS